MFTIFIGPEKTGTTSLYHLFYSSHETKLSRKTKELFFWDKYFENGFKWYLHKFSGSNSNNYIDFAPTIFGNIETYKRIIKSEITDLNLVITLRDPVNRAYSHYLHLLRYGLKNISFIDCLKKNKEIIASSSYKDRLKQLLKASEDSTKVFVIIFEDMISNHKLIEDFAGDKLQLNITIETSLNFQQKNIALMPKYQILSIFFVKLSTIAKRMGLNFIVNILKKTGFYRWFYSGPVPTITKEEKDFASKFLDAEIEIYNKLVRNSVNGIVDKNTLTSIIE